MARKSFVSTLSISGQVGAVKQSRNGSSQINIHVATNKVGRGYWNHVVIAKKGDEKAQEILAGVPENALVRVADVVGSGPYTFYHDSILEIAS